MEAVLLIGLQGAGKTSFFLEHFLGTHVHISLDVVRTRRRQWGLVRACLELGQRFVLDNTNLTREERRVIIRSSRTARFRVVGYGFEPDVASCLVRNRMRRGRQRVPDVAIRSSARRLEQPIRDEGFDELYTVRAVPGGSFVVEHSPPLQAEVQS